MFFLVYSIVSLFYCTVVLFPCPACYTLYGTMARYSLFVLKVPLNTKQTNRSTGLEAMSSLFESWWCGSTLTCSFQWKCLFFSSAGNYVVIIVFVLLCVLVDYIQRWVNCIVCNVLFSHKVVLCCFIFFLIYVSMLCKKNKFHSSVSYFSCRFVVLLNFLNFLNVCISIRPELSLLLLHKNNLCLPKPTKMLITDFLYPVNVCSGFC